MSDTCTVLFHVKNPKTGEVVESKLFNDLLHYTSKNRELSKEYYAIGTNQEYLSKAAAVAQEQGKTLHFDENGEILLRDLIDIANIDLEQDKLLQVLNKDLGEGIYEYADAIRRIEEFRNTNSFADKVDISFAPLDKDQSSQGKVYISVIPKTQKVKGKDGKEVVINNTANNQKKLHDTIRNKELEKRLIDLLNRYKVSVKFLESDDEGGQYSTDNVTRAENGLYGLIEIKQGGYVSDVLAEETGHFVVGALGDNPLVKRLEKLLESKAAQEQAIGSEDYKNAFLGNNPPREIAGRLIGKALKRRLDNSIPAWTLANRIANVAKRIFYNLTKQEVAYNAAKAEQIANKIAYRFTEGDNQFSVENALSVKEILHDKTLTGNQKVFAKVFDEMGRMVKALEGVSRDNNFDNILGQMKASLGIVAFSAHDGNSNKSTLQMDVAMQADAFAFDGIVNALVQITDILGPGKELNQLLDSVDDTNPSEFYANVARNGRKLRQARILINSIGLILQTINDAKEANTIVNANGTTLNDVKYQDSQGIWRSVDVKEILNTALAILSTDTSTLRNKEIIYFTRFCEDIYGGKYITTTVGKLWKNIFQEPSDNRETSYRIQDLIEGTGVYDIDVFHRYLGSMSNNPDIIGQIADKVVKTANKVADDQTMRYNDRLVILKRRAKTLGFDTTDLIERDEKGIPTGNMIVPPASPTQTGLEEEDFIYDAYMQDSDYVPCVNYGKWEKAREDFKKQKWEEFKQANPQWEGWSGLMKGYKWDSFFGPKMKEWNKANSIKVTVKDEKGDVKYVKWVPNRLYESNAWDHLLYKYDENKRSEIIQWVNDYRTIKKELDSLLPLGSTSSYRLPQFRGTFMNSVRNSAPLEKGLFKKQKSLVRTFGRRTILESFAETSEDTDYGDLSTMNNSEDELLGTALDYEREKVNRIPIFGVNKLENMNDLSTDIFHSMLAYASMATTYSCLDSVVDSLEVGKSVMYNREVGSNNFINEGLDKVHNWFSSKYAKAKGEYETYMEGTKNRAYGRYLKFLNGQVYGITATTFGLNIKGKRILLNKINQNLTSLAGSMYLKGNVLGGTVNTLTGFNNIFKEALAGSQFSTKDWIMAHKYYWSHFVDLWAVGIGDLHKTDKLSLFMQQMNVLSNSKERYRSWYTTRSRLNNFWNQLGYLPYSSGDHYMQAMSYLALAHGIKLYDYNGNEISNLWNAFTLAENTDEFGYHKAGKTLTFKRMCPLDASEITTDNLRNEGVFIKKGIYSEDEFQDWLSTQTKDATQDSKSFVDDKKKEFRSMSMEELIKFRSSRFHMLSNILEKVENYLSSNSPLVGVPAFTDEELKYIQYKNVGTGNYADIMQVAKNDIYNLIWTKSDETSFMMRAREINNRLHGIYNKEDKTAWHQNWYTNAVLAMKGWALGNIEMMYSSNHYSLSLGVNTEGFLNTALKLGAVGFAGKFKKGRFNLRDLGIALFCPWSKHTKEAMTKAGFSTEQYANARRTAISMYLIGILLTVMLATAPGSGGDDEEPSPLKGLVYYLSMRTLYEQAALTTQIGVEGRQLAETIPTGWSATYDLLKLVYEGIGALFTDEDNKTFYYQSDSNRHDAGDPKYEQHLERLIPYYKSWWGITHPYDAAKNYDFGRKMR